MDRRWGSGISATDMADEKAGQTGASQAVLRPASASARPASLSTTEDSSANNPFVLDEMPKASGRLYRMLPDILRALHRVKGWEGTPLFALDPMPTTGLAHDHVRIIATGRLLRIPRQSQMRLSAADNLAYECACFSRTAPSGSPPKLYDAIPPCAELPMGALILDEIFGRPSILPDDLPEIARALAGIHALPLPIEAERPPFLDPDDTLADTLVEIETQAVHLDAGVSDSESRALIRRELAAAQELLKSDARPPRTLIAFDAHPGNFLIDGRGRARVVDLEKCRYGAAGLDLAHATLYTSTTWDLASQAVLTQAHVAEFYSAWLAHLPEQEARLQKPWLLALRRVMWLWSVTWCAKWRVESQGALKEDKLSQDSTEDWSAENTADDEGGAALIAHVADRTAHYLASDVIAHVVSEWSADSVLARSLSADSL